MTERSWFGELVLIAVLGAFAIGCMVVIASASRMLPNFAAAQSATPAVAPSSGQGSATETRIALTPRPPTPIPTTTAKAAATPTEAELKKSYASVDGKTLAQSADQYKGKKIIITGTLYYTRPDGESTWVQIITPDRIFIDASYRGDLGKLRTDQKVLLYGTGAGTTTIVAADGKQYTQPFINPADFVDPA